MRLSINVVRLAVIGAGTIASAAAAEPAIDQLFAEVAPAVMALEATDETGKPIDWNSAVAIGPETAITRCRVVDAAIKLQLHVGKDIRSVKLGVRDDERDLCEIKADLSGIATRVTLAAEAPIVGGRVVAIAQSYSSGPVLSTGVISALRKRGNMEAIQFSAPIAPGATGGALLDETGRLIGIIDYQLRDGQNVNFAAPARWIAEIDSRALTQTETAAAIKEAVRLWREGKAEDLERHCLEWSRHQPESRIAWRWLGVAQARVGHVKEAEQSLRRAVESDPDDADAWAGVARMLLLQDKPAEARDLVKAGLTLRPESASLWLQMGMAEFALGHQDLAANAFETVTRIAPWNEWAFRGLMDLARTKGDTAGEIDAARRLAGLNPADSTNWLNLALAYIRGKKLVRAQAAVDQAASLRGEDGEVFWVRAQIAFADKRYSESIRLANASLAKKPMYPADIWTQLGHAYYSIQQYPMAIRAYREALKLDPKLLTARDWLIVTLKDNDQLDEATTLLEPLTKSEPKNPFVWRQLGMVRHKQANWSAAVAAYRESLKLDPQQPKALASIVEAEAFAGDGAAALADYEVLRGMDRHWAETAWRDNIRVLEAMQQ